MKKILFVCIHNTARSVMAEALFNSMAKDWRAESAGVERAEGVNEVVKRLLAEKGLRAKEKPRTIDDVNLDEFDLIIAVCEESSCVVLPVSKLERWHIEDPVGKDEGIYREILAEIEEKVRALVEELEKTDNQGFT
ncbi:MULTISPECIES: low molecular weight phosphatase family protein [unclassified Archaeoglobus]|uniref:arsenate-mycothiol transferase ArsC n=1 Tax=unclassified Archaeoglobus TaxID=2643606 RepID=UPI0025C3A0EA|nr:MULTISPECIES: low molecular weight phosphatase family protein [unclassified Archaeoglobus]